jgi:hypothetical protein
MPFHASDDGDEILKLASNQFAFYLIWAGDQTRGSPQRRGFSTTFASHRQASMTSHAGASACEL